MYLNIRFLALFSNLFIGKHGNNMTILCANKLRSSVLSFLTLVLSQLTFFKFQFKCLQGVTETCRLTDSVSQAV